jgi:opacity protein-like surface antigen
MTSKQAIGVFIILALIGLSAAGPARAQSAETPGGWQFELTPYFWGAGIKADLKVGLLPEQSVDASFSDIWESLHFALMGTFEARKDRWGFLFDGVYANLTKSLPTPGDIFGDLKAGIKLGVFSLAGTFRAVEGKAAVDVVGGVRYVNFTADLELTSGIYAGRQGSASQGWVDGFGGARLQFALAKAWTLVGYADVGAGGSKLSWQALAGLEVKFSKALSGKLGYRYFYFERENNDVLFKFAMAGFYAGLGIGF